MRPGPFATSLRVSVAMERAHAVEQEREEKSRSYYSSYDFSVETDHHADERRRVREAYLRNRQGQVSQDDDNSTGI